MRRLLYSLLTTVILLVAVVDGRPNLFVPLFVRRPDGGLMPSMSLNLGFIGDWIFPKSREVLKVHKSADEDRAPQSSDDLDTRLEASGGIGSWIMPPSRSGVAQEAAVPVDASPDGGDDNNDEAVLNAFIGLPDEIKTNLANASVSLKNRFTNVSADLSSKLSQIHSKLADDVSNAIASQSKNQTKV